MIALRIGDRFIILVTEPLSFGYQTAILGRECTGRGKSGLVATPRLRLPVGSVCVGCSESDHIVTSHRMDCTAAWFVCLAVTLCVGLTVSGASLNCFLLPCRGEGNYSQKVLRVI